MDVTALTRIIAVTVSTTADADRQVGAEEYDALRHGAERAAAAVISYLRDHATPEETVVRSQSTYRAVLHSIRATIAAASAKERAQALLALAPLSCSKCGTPITNIDDLSAVSLSLLIHISCNGRVTFPGEDPVAPGGD